MLVRFWGTRGSIAAPGQPTVRYGGNTSCVEVRSGDSLAILDCGTGARGLGGYLAGQGGPIRAHLLLTHFHWDHIQGFPFFLPVFLPGSELNVYGSAGLEQGLEEAMSGQMQYTYFPVRLADLQSRISYHELVETTFQAGQLSVASHFLNHTCPALGYRLTLGGTSVAYMTDHEPFWPHDPDSALKDCFAHPGDRQHVEFLEGVDLLIHDAQYTAQEYPARRGWGHSPIEYVVDVAVAAGVRRLALFHHDPPRSDDALDAVVELARQRARDRGSELGVFAAAEGQVVELAEVGDVEPAQRRAPLSIAAPPARVLILGNADRRRPLRQALMEDGYQISEAELDASILDSSVGQPDLMVVAPPPEVDAAAVVQAISLAIKRTPVVAILEGAVDDASLRRVGQVAADAVVAPYGLPNLRARVRASLARRQPRTGRDGRSTRLPALDSLQLADRLPAAELQSMLQSAARCGFRPSDLLFRQGEPAGGAYYIHSGLVRIIVDGQDGAEVTVGFAGPGDTVGEASALDGAPRSASAVAMEPTEASYISREVFRQTLERAPQTSVRLLRLLARRLREVDQRLAGQAGRRETTAGHGANGASRSAAVEAETLRRYLGQLQELTEQIEATETQLEGYALEVTSAYLRVREWRQGMQALRTIAHLLGAARSPASLYQQTVKTLNRLVPADATALYLLEGRRLVQVASRGEAARSWELEQTPPEVSEALNHGRPRVAWSQSRDGHDRDAHCSVVLPVRAQGRALGVLWMLRADAPTDDELALAEIVSTACAVALHQQGVGAEAQIADLESTLEMEVERARRLGYPIGVLIGRLDAHGDGQGSEDLAAQRPLLARAVQEALRRTDIVAASPSVDLGVILPGLAPEHLAVVEARVGEAIRRTFADRRSAANGTEMRMGATVLFATEADARQLLERALSSMNMQHAIP